MNRSIDILQQDALQLLRQLIETPSFSREEAHTAALLSGFLQVRNIPASQVGNNIYAVSKCYDAAKPTLLLNSHHDTVKPNPQYTKDPFQAIVEDGKLFGLGSNDAGGCLVALLATFLYFYGQDDLQYNLVFAGTAEEEISGTGGIELVIPHLPPIDCAIVGEPTKMDMAVAERGLMVLDCISYGRAGHAAREEGENAIYKAMRDIGWFQTFRLPKQSSLLGPSKMSVTVIDTENKAHNVVPAQCRFVVDTRINEQYSFEEVIGIIRTNVQCEVTPRSTRLRSTSISLDHPLVKAGLALQRHYYGSPTTSDKALMSFPALKMGPGDSARSHTADEYIHIEELNEGIGLYIRLLQQIL